MLAIVDCILHLLESGMDLLVFIQVLVSFTNTSIQDGSFKVDCPKYSVTLNEWSQKFYSLNIY